MGRFERGLAKAERADLERLVAEDDDPMVALRELVAEHRAAQTPLERYLSDKLQAHITEVMITGSTTIQPLTLDEVLSLDGLT